MQPDASAIKSVFSKAGIDVTVGESSLGVVCRCDAGDAYKALDALKTSDDAFVMLVDLLGCDTGEDVEITYHVRSLSRDEDVYVKCAVAYGGDLESVWQVYPSALMPERETAEMFGLKLCGHPNPRRLLTVDGSEPFLLRSVAIRTAEEVRDR